MKVNIYKENSAKNGLKKRDANLDLIRCLAVFCVISVHYFLNCGFYQEPMIGQRMYIMMVMRTFFMICVPLFVLLTGYLMSKKELSVSYYFGIVKTLGIYVGACLACNAYKMIFLKTNMFIKDIFISITDFSAAPYSGYINMYIGLFVLIPFLNLIYKGLESKRRKQIAIISLLFCTTLPSVLNIYVKLVPTYWLAVYPLTYYFIGAYLKEYDLNISLKKNAVLIVLSVLTFATFNYFFNYGDKFKWGVYCDWGSLENLVDSILVFIFLKHLNLGNLPKWIKKVILFISNLALGIYLVSWIFDNYAYAKLNAMVPFTPHKLEYYIVMVLFVFACSMLLSFILDVLYRVLSKIFGKCTYKLVPLKKN